MQLVGDSTEFIEQEKLPNIDDHGNPLEVAEYVDDIYQYYWTMEVIIFNVFPIVFSYITLMFIFSEFRLAQYGKSSMCMCFNAVDG